MIKKLLTYSLVVTTMVWSVGLLATPLAVGAAVSGDLIKLQCATGASVNDPCKAVYYLGADGKRYVFPNEKTYMTWYSNFSGVQTVSSTEMSSYPIGGNVTYRPGVKMIKINTDPKVYAVAANGTLRWVTTGAIAEALYGALWNKGMVEDVSDAFFVNYTVGADINAAGDFNKSTETTNAATINDDKNLGGSASTGTSLTVALASDTPASGLIMGNTINNKFTKVNLTASADGNIVVDSLTIRRGGGVASDAAFSSIAILDGATMKRIGNTQTINSEHMATFNTDITVPAGTSKSIYIVGNMGSLASYAGEVPTLDLYSVALSGSGAVVGTLPIIGNYQNLNGTITVGGLSVSNGANNPSASTQKIGTTKYLVSGVKLVANSVEDFDVTQINFNQGGTAGDADVKTLELLVDDVVVATLAGPVSKDAFFNLATSPIKVLKGKTVQVDLRLTINDGSSRTIRFDIKDESDISAKGKTYGAEVKVADGGAGATTDADPFWTAPVTTVDTGSLRIGAATLAAANISDDGDNTVLGKFEFEAKGESIEISSLPIAFTVTTSSGSLATDATVDLLNIKVVDATGKIVAGPKDPTSKGTPGTNTQELLVATSTDTFTVPVGVNVYTIIADLDADFGANDTIVARIHPGQVTAKGSTTGLTVTPTPSSDQSSATMTVQAAALSASVSNTPVAQTIVAGSKNFVFSNLVLGAESSGEDISVTTVKVSVKTSTANPAQFSNFSLYDGATELSTTNDPDSDTSSKTTAGADATATFTLTTPLVITKGTSKTLTVKADISNAATSGTVNVGFVSGTGSEHVTAKGKVTANTATITMSSNQGAAMTLSSVGTLTIVRDSSSPKNGLLPSNASGLTFAVFNVNATNEAVNIEKLYLTGVQANSGGFDQISKVYVYDGSTLLASVTPTSTDGTDKTVLIDVTSSPIQIPKDTAKLLTIKVDTAVVNREIGSNGTAGQGLWLKINAGGDITAKGAQSGTTVTSKTVTNASSTAQYLFRSVPTITLNDGLPTGEKVAGGTLTTGTDVDVYKFKVSASSAGPVGLYSVSFVVTTSTATSTNWKLRDATEVVAATTTAEVITDNTVGNVELLKLMFTDNNAVPASGGTNVKAYEVPAGETRSFTLRSDLTCSVTNCAAASSATGGSIQFQFLGDTSLTATLPNSGPNVFNTLYDGSFIWTDFSVTVTQKYSSSTASSAEQFSNGYLVAKSDGGKLEATSTAVTFIK